MRNEITKKDEVSQVIEHDFCCGKGSLGYQEKNAFKLRLMTENENALMSSHILIIANKDVSRLKSLGKQAVS